MDLDALSSSIASLSLKQTNMESNTIFVNNLVHDIFVIQECYETKRMSLDRSKLLLKPSNHGSLICAIFQEIIKSRIFPDIVEVMPYIDEYLEYIDQE